MKEKKYSINFHETFFPDLEYISRILEITDSTNYLSIGDIFSITGIPSGKSSGKIEPHIKYAAYMGLIDYEKKDGKYSLKKTLLGEVVFREDPYLQEKLSKFLCHYFLTSKYIGADMWFEIFRRLPSFLGNEILDKNINSEINITFKLSKNTKLRPFIGTYTEESSLGLLNLLSLEVIDKDSTKYKYRYHNYEEALIYVYSYTLLKDLKMLDEGRGEFSIIEVFQDLLWNRAFNWDENQGMNVLSILETKQIIRMNKQLNPITMIFNIAEKEVLDKLYSLLI